MQQIEMIFLCNFRALPPDATTLPQHSNPIKLSTWLLLHRGVENFQEFHGDITC